MQGETDDLKKEYDALKSSNERLGEALKNLANEAAGFLSMADPTNHGNTNMHVLAVRIDEAKALLTSTTVKESA